MNPNYFHDPGIVELANKYRIYCLTQNDSSEILFSVKIKKSVYLWTTLPTPTTQCKPVEAAPRDASKVSKKLRNLSLILKYRAEQFPNDFGAPDLNWNNMATVLKKQTETM